MNQALQEFLRTGAATPRCLADATGLPLHAIQERVRDQAYLSEGEADLVEYSFPAFRKHRDRSDAREAQVINDLLAREEKRRRGF